LVVIFSFHTIPNPGNRPPISPLSRRRNENQRENITKKYYILHIIFIIYNN
jgi:hypothetical protein